MKRRNVTIWSVALVVLYFVLPNAVAGVLFCDGQTYNIDSVINDTVWVENSASGEPTTVNLLPGGSIIETLRAYENSIVTISGGNIGVDLYAHDNSIINISDVSIDRHLYACQNSNVSVSGGTIDGIYANNNSIVTISGGNIGTIGTGLYTYENAIISVSGGMIGGTIFAGYNQIGESVIIFDGSDFAINGTSVAYGIFDTGGENSVHGTLTGTLANGGYLDNEFYIYADSSIILIPEPTTLLLLGLGAVMLRRKHWKT